MTERELLELAAKAAGIDYCTGANVPQYPDMLCLDTSDRFWRPLHDDGDALRLAVKLGLWVDVHRPETFTRVCPELEDVPFTQENFNGDPYAATRRAIVRAAAAIGKDGGAQT